MDPIFSKRQLLQSLGQFILTMATSMLVFDSYTAFVEKGVLDAVWLPFWNAVIVVLGVFGISRVGPK